MGCDVVPAGEVAAATPEPAAQPSVLVADDGHVRIMTLNRPALRNAINQDVCQRLGDAMAELDLRQDLRVGILRAAGPAFCAGVDLREFRASGVPGLPGRGFAGFVEAPPQKPLIAAVQGMALGGGLEVVLACDLVVATTDAQFGLPEVRLGLVAAAGGLIRLPKRVPPAIAKEMVLTGATIDAAKAQRYGLVNQVCARDDLAATSLALARRVAGNAPIAVRVSKQVIDDSAGWTGDPFERQAELVAAVHARRMLKRGPVRSWNGVGRAGSGVECRGEVE